MSRGLILCGVEARRPASWLLLLAAIGGASLAGGGRIFGLPPAAVGFLLGGQLAVAAIVARCTTPAGHLGGGWMGLAAKIVWPLIGAVLGAIAGPGASAAVTLAGILLGMGLATALCEHLRTVLASRADVASATLLITAAIGLAASWGWTRFPDDPRAAGASLVGAVVAAGIGVSVIAGIPLPPRSAGGSGRLIAVGDPARGRLDLCGMAASLAAMVYCLFLVPDAAAANVIVTLSCFVALAVPEATIAPTFMERGWGRLLETVPRQGIGGRFGAADPVAESLGFHLLVLGWPSLVAFLLIAADAGRSTGPAVTFAVLAAAAGITGGTVSVLRRRVDGATTLAAVTALLVVAGMVAASVFAG